MQRLHGGRERLAAELAAAGDQPDAGDRPADALPSPRLGPGQETEMFHLSCTTCYTGSI